VAEGRGNHKGGSSGAAAPLFFKREGGGGLSAEMGLGFRFSFKVFLLFFLNCLSFCVLKVTIYRQNIVWSSNLIPQLLFFCKFDFS
jgi:hypothetical protein